MKNLTAKCLALTMLALLLSGSVQAKDYMNGDDCCRQYECGCNPLYCGAWDLEIQGGVNPILWRSRGPLVGVNCMISSTSPVITILTEFPKFRRFFRIPWIVGGQIGYQMSDNTRVYVEFDYSQARHKKNKLITTNAITTSPGTTTTGTITFNFNKYRLFEGYVGVRYYWDRWCDSLSFFLGGKIGFVRHRRQKLTSIIFSFPTATPVTLTEVPFNRRSTRVSGGGNIGLDYCICGNWSLVLTGEVVASCGPRGVGSIVLPLESGLIGFTNLITPDIGTELRFPVTFGVRYSF